VTSWRRRLALLCSHPYNIFAKAAVAEHAVGARTRTAERAGGAVGGGSGGGGGRVGWGGRVAGRVGGARGRLGGHRLAVVRRAAPSDG